MSPSAARTRSALVLALVAPFLTAGAQEPPAAPPSPETFFGRSQVTAVDLVIEVRDAEGRVPADLSPADFAVTEDGEPVPVVGLELQAGGAAAGGGAGEAGAPRLDASAAPAAE
ncbi:MAG TPA: hypothetical protein VHM02_02880, partial [Thermoanaerobaculia bacterium]|nr:hypothetical protein [Thermoanaerobaculia bacterium]